jgi:hypothetical protein
MRWPLLISGMILTSLTAGCASNPHGHGGRFIAEYQPGEHPCTTCTPYQAVYALYQWRKPPAETPPHTWIPEQEVAELYVRGLGRWKPVGFEKGSNGELLAVAGDEKIPLEDGHYCWHITTASEDRGMQRILSDTGENVVAVATAPFALAACVCMLPVFATMGLGVMVLGL